MSISAKSPLGQQSYLLNLSGHQWIKGITQVLTLHNGPYTLSQPYGKLLEVCGATKTLLSTKEKMQEKPPFCINYKGTSVHSAYSSPSFFPAKQDHTKLDMVAS
jgi:hypothetical protein